MTSYASQASIQMSAPGLPGRAASGAGFSKLLTPSELRGLLGTGSAGLGAKYLADDSTWKAIDLSSYLTTSTAASTYLPLAGGTLTGDLKFTDATYDIGKSGATRPRDGFFSRNLTLGGLVNLQNSTTPMEFNLHNTYTSATSREYLKMLAVAGSAYQIGSAIGSAGGTNRGISIGHSGSAGTFVPGLTVSTSNIVTVGSPAGAPYLNFSVTNGGYASLYSHSAWRLSSASNSLNASVWTGDVNSGTNSTIYFGTYNKASVDASLFGTGSVFQINTATGQVIETPPTSVTLSANGQFSVEMTSNTTGNLVYRGSDGTTRRAAIVFV